MPSRTELINNLWHFFLQMRKKLAVGHGSKSRLITPSQGMVLRCVSDQGSAQVKEIANSLHVSSSAVSQLVDSLVEKKYLIRTQYKQDRRRANLSLSPKAARMLKKFERQNVDLLTDLFSILSDKELSLYVALNKKITF